MKTLRYLSDSVGGGKKTSLGFEVDDTLIFTHKDHSSCAMMAKILEVAITWTINIDT